jgi:hypothetical protein
MSSKTIIDTGLWEVWIEFDEFDTGNFGTLYIIGEIQTGKQKARFIKLPCDYKTLQLMIPVQPHDSYGPVKEVLYSEPIESIDKYDAVRIYAGNELLASFEEIEIMI